MLYFWCHPVRRAYKRPSLAQGSRDLSRYAEIGELYITVVCQQDVCALLNDYMKFLKLTVRMYIMVP